MNSGWRYRMVKKMNNLYGDMIDDNVKEDVEIILKYRESFSNKIKLLKSKKIKSGIMIVDFLKNIAIITNDF